MPCECSANGGREGGAGINNCISRAEALQQMCEHNKIVWVWSPCPAPGCQTLPSPSRDIPKGILLKSHPGIQWHQGWDGHRAGVFPPAWKPLLGRARLQSKGCDGV